jgi:hypothetical protein
MCLCPIVVIFGALVRTLVIGVLVHQLSLPTSYVSVGKEECFFTWRELQSVIKLEFSYFKFFYENSSSLTHTYCSYGPVNLCADTLNLVTA